MREPGRALYGLRRGLVLTAAVLFVAACGAASTPAPTATPTIAPTPSPTPLDVGRAFLDIVSAPNFTAKITLDGTIEMGVTATMTGTMTGSGEDSQSQVQIAVAGTKVETETVKVGGKEYGRTSPGPWLISPPKPNGEADSLNEWLRSLATIEDIGVETKNGRKLHHLSVGDEQLAPAILGFDSPAYKNTVVTIDFFAEDDGTPAVFAVDGTWVQVINGQDVTVKFVLDMTLANVGSPVTITAPTDVWTKESSPLGYVMAHPAGFAVDHRDGYDAYVKQGVDWLYISPYTEGKGLSPEGFRDAIVELVAPDWGAPLETPSATTLGGVSAYFATYNYTYDDGTKETAFDVTATHGDLGWEISLFSVPGAETQDLATFQKYLATFAFQP
ncbi:MAG: hypothetical protein ABIV26_00860 [Candidatus Limnocylindrales bacterium]